MVCKWFSFTSLVDKAGRVFLPRTGVSQISTGCLHEAKPTLFIAKPVVVVVLISNGHTA